MHWSSPLKTRVYMFLTATTLPYCAFRVLGSHVRRFISLQMRSEAHIELLANDLLEGRGPGTRGHEIAGAYIPLSYAR